MANGVKSGHKEDNGEGRTFASLARRRQNPEGYPSQGGTRIQAWSVRTKLPKAG